MRPQAPSWQTGAGGGGQDPGLTACPRDEGGSALPLRIRRSVRQCPPSQAAPSLPAHPRAVLSVPRLWEPGTLFSAASPARLPPGETAGAARLGGERYHGQSDKRARSGGRWTERGALRSWRGAAWSAVGREPAAVVDTGGGCAYLAGSARRGGRALDPRGMCAAAADSAGPRCVFPHVGLLKGFY